MWVSHRNTYRGKSLGNVYTDEQKNAVALGTFNDLYIGDYWTMGGHDWLIADINYWLNKGDTPCNTNHLVILPRGILGTEKMKDSYTTNGGYASKTFSLATYKNLIGSVFGTDHILSYRGQITNAATNGIPTGITWADRDVELMNENMVYGSKNASSMNTGTGANYNMESIDTTQLSLFRLRPELIVASELSYWLRDIASSNSFCAVLSNGVSALIGAAETRGIRPTCGITG